MNKTPRVLWLSVQQSRPKKKTREGEWSGQQEIILRKTHGQHYTNPAEAGNLPKKQEKAPLKGTAVWVPRAEEMCPLTSQRKNK